MRRPKTVQLMKFVGVCPNDTQTAPKYLDNAIAIEIFGAPHGVLQLSHSRSAAFYPY
jgi:hypothetical protein